MKVIFPYSLRDQEQAVRLAEWIKELGGCTGHSVLVVRDHRTSPEAGEVLKSARFDKWEEIVIRDDAYDKWPESCNLMFRRAAKHIEYGTREPFLWLEPDVAPLKEGWLDAIETEYKEAGKPFSGDFVHLNEPGFRSHCSGVAVYPGVMSAHAGDALLAHEVAWDVVGASQIIPQMHKSKLILHRWKHPVFDNWQQVEERIFAVKPDCVLFHASKDGSLLSLLRQKKNLPVGLQPDSVAIKHAGCVTEPESQSDWRCESENAIEKVREDSIEPSGPAPVAHTSRGGQNFTCDVLIKSFPPDYKRLSYCLRSIDKFASGFRRVVIVIPDTPEVFGFGLGMSNPDCHTVRIPESGEGYLFQQAVKAQAHEYTDADYILHVDSDCFFTQPVTPETFMRDGKPIWYMTPYPGLEVPWEAITEKFMQAPVPYEFMRRLPFLIPRFLHEAIAEFCQETHGQSLTDYILSQPIRAFSEFNALGALAYAKFRDKFHWIDTTKEELPEPVLIQKWSHEPFTDAHKAEFEKILGDADHNPALKQTKEGIWILANDSHISKWIEEKGQLQHDYETLPIALSEIPVGGTVVDVGAFIGDTALPFLERIGPAGKLHAFEPNPIAFECLSRNLAGRKNVRLYKMAVSDVQEGLRLQSAENAGASTIAADGQPVTCISLDTMAELEQIDFIKIDVEGHELRVLKGAEQTINRFHPKLLIEINEGALQRQGASAEEISDWLFKHGYKWRPLQSNITANSPQYDILCTHIRSEQIVESCSTSGPLVNLTPDADAEIHRLAEQLKGFMGNSVTTRRVRNVLHEVGVIELPYRFKRRKGWKRKKAQVS